MAKQPHLSRRERQIMDILYQRGRATAQEVLEALPNPPTYSAVRAMLRVLEDKEHVKHESDGTRYVFIPRVTREKAKRVAVRHLLQVFFNGSPEQAVATLLDESARNLSDEQWDQLEKQIAQARKKGQ